jgi:hypothetical protein
VTRAYPTHVTDAVAFVEMTPPVAAMFAAIVRQAARYGVKELSEQVRAMTEVYEDPAGRAAMVDFAKRNLYSSAARNGYAVLTCTVDEWTNPSGGWRTTVRVSAVPLSDVERP